MIKWINRNELDVEKYNTCIDKSSQGLLYAYSWYLDIVCTDWMVLVFNDYEAVMPLPYRKKLTLKYIYPPFWMLQLGVFSQGEVDIENQLVLEVLNKYRFVELRLNSSNTIGNSEFIHEKYFQILDLNVDHNSVTSNYQSDRKKDVRKAKKNELITQWNDRPENLIQLFQNNVGTRTPEIKEKDYQVLLELIETCVRKNVGEILSVYQGNDLVASAFFLKYRDTVTILCSSTDFNNRNNGANTYLIDEAIKKHSSSYKVFNFGGSSMPSIAKYFKSFGAKDVSYPMILKRKFGL